MKYDVFISYSRTDYTYEDKSIIPGNIISQIKEMLQANGYTYWFDEDGIYSGDSFTEVIAEAIQDSEIFLFISTEASNASKWTKHELAVAKHLGKKTIPFRVDNSKYDKSILMYLAPLDYIDYEKNPHKAFESLIAAINHHYSQKREAEEAKKRKKEQELKEKEKAEALKNAEKMRLARLSEIDAEIANLQAEIVKFEADKSEIKAKLNSLNEQISHHKAKISSLNTSQNEINASIKKLEQEKKSLSKDYILKKEPKEDFFNTPKTESKATEPNSSKSASKSLFLKSFFKYLKDLRKRYWFHLLLAIGVTIVASLLIFVSFIKASYALYFLLASLCGIISLYGVIQLLRGKKDGLVTLLLNSIIFYLIWYLESQYTIFAYMGLAIYLFFVSILYLIHKSDKDSSLSWGRMTKSRLRNPKKTLILTAIICIILSFAIPYIYAQKCGMRSYDIEDADYVLTNSINGILRDPYAAKNMGDDYIPYSEPLAGEKSMYVFKHHNLEPDVHKALWWYELANNNRSYYSESYDKKITYCKDYIEAQEKGYAYSERYGKCGINKINGNLVRISVDSYSDGVNEGEYSERYLQSNLSYNISLTDGDFSQGKFEVGGATLDSIERNKQKLYNIQGDTVKMRFIQEGSIISEKIIPVIKVETRIKLESKDTQLSFNKEYTMIALNPIEGAKWQIYNENDKYTYRIKIIDESSERVRFILKDRPRNEKIHIKYIANNKQITSTSYYTGTEVFNVVN